MDSALHSPTLPFGSDAPVGCLYNGGSQRYLLEAESTSGCVAWQIADGTILTSGTTEASLPASAWIKFWACAGLEDTSPAGRIVYFDGHGNALTQVDVRQLRELEYLDVSYNTLTDLDLTGLTELQALDADHNLLARLDIHDQRGLRVLNCADNRLTTLDLCGLNVLQVLDLSDNRLVSLNLTGCTSLKDVKTSGNPVDFTQARA